MASTEDDIILEMDLTIRHELTIDPVREVLRLGNEEFKLNQRCIEASLQDLSLIRTANTATRLSRPKHGSSAGSKQS